MEITEMRDQEIDSLSQLENNRKLLIPEHRLLVAILVRSIMDLLSDDQNDARDARKWFMFLKVRPFSFVWVCQMLGVHALALRDELMRKGCFNRNINKRPFDLRKKLGAFISKSD